ncbi:DinB family protein [Sabulilitoribacter multivorans]|uniref:DinB family protein n=1 Tax=Flaviramulus multivorans TaxID=1304750 RepID=A0ABS9IM97_9FLAO|nr:DinB family protein [Flaviramulus multivorans]MCF7561724.1 DinB family protein [Flaviramulus multivorans]
MNIIIKSTIETLQKSRNLLSSLSDEEFCNHSIPPYHSSIGSHLRHILDFYDCIFNRDLNNQIDLTARSRSKEVESSCSCAKAYLNSIIDRLNTLEVEMQDKIVVIDDLGLGKVEIPYTFGGLFAQATSHTIHHYAIINYILDRQGFSINDENFGYNPTTPKEVPLN